MSSRWKPISSFLVPCFPASLRHIPLPLPSSVRVTFLNAQRTPPSPIRRPADSVAGYAGRNLRSSWRLNTGKKVSLTCNLLGLLSRFIRIPPAFFGLMFEMPFVQLPLWRSHLLCVVLLLSVLGDPALGCSRTADYACTQLPPPAVDQIITAHGILQAAFL